jgi:uncharacterized membrane protein (UPF0127 family)
MRQLFGLFALLAVLLFLSGCSQSTKVMDTAKVQLPDGTVIDCEVPLTTNGIERGLMYRDGICEKCGMLFVFQNDARQRFWMKNMKFDIDIIFINKDWKVVGIAQDVPPCASEPCAIYSPNSNARYVLELEANATAKHNIFLDSEIKRID